MGIESTPRYKTIDNLGIDSSIKYAENQYELSSAKELTLAPAKVTQSAELQQATPITSEYDTIFQTSLRNKGWAHFLIPPGYLQQGRTCFSFQMIPSLGSEEQLLNLKQRITDKVEKEKQNMTQIKGSRQELLEKELLVQKTQSDGDKLSKLLETIRSLDKILTDLNSQKNRYQRG
jgi:hypothetical protein